jgi:N-methylhydantoinase A
VTDAALVAGIIDPSGFLGGRMAVDQASARRAIADRLAGPLGMSAHRAANGVLRLATSHMAQLIGEMTVQVGLDPRDYALVGFGGAGPMFAAALMAEVEAAHALVPPYPGVWSALGGAAADIGHDYARSLVGPLACADLDGINATAGALLEAARADLARDGADGAEARFRFFMDVRYAGQSHEIPVPVATLVPFGTDTIRQVAQDFDALHEKLYAHRRTSEPRHLVTVRLEVRVPRHLGLPAPRLAPRGQAVVSRTRAVWFADRDGALEAEIVRRGDLPVGHRLTGPAIVEEDQSNTVVPPGMTCTVDAAGNLVIERSAA